MSESDLRDALRHADERIAVLVTALRELRAMLEQEGRADLAVIASVAITPISSGQRRRKYASHGAVHA